MRTSIFKLFGLGVALALFAMAAGHSGQIGLAQVSCTVTVSAGSPIQAAIDAASAGAVICVEAGSYSENLTINKKQDLTLQGAGRDDVTLDGSAGVADQKPAILIQDSKKITIKGFKIVKSRRGVHAIDTTGLVLADNSFKNNLRQGILLQRAEATLTGNLIQDTQPDRDGARGQGVNAIDSQAVLKDNTISGSAEIAIVVAGGSDQSGSTVTISKNTITDNALAGIGVSNNSTATIDGNTITRNVEEGIFVGQSAHAQITNNQITESKPNPKGENCCGFGINLRFNAQATIQGNTISQNTDVAILVLESAQATIRQNTIVNNRSVGVLVVNNARATIQNNTIDGNLIHGILLGYIERLADSVEATIINNRIKGHRPGPSGEGQAIAIFSSSRATMRDNILSDNLVGVSIYQQAQATITSNTILNNTLAGLSRLLPIW